jgi:hypothetical protein
MSLEKFAVSEPPYVVWKAQARGPNYRIDAFTGTILEKR